MLAKKLWHLLYDTNSLFYRVSKAKYFSFANIFEAKTKSGSHAWRSILGAHKVISPGAKWRIGYGNSTYIYNYNWLLGDDCGKVVTTPSFFSTSAKVAELLDRELGWWNVLLIDNLFLPFEAQRIKSIPICMTPQDDILIWSKSTSGMYMVKLGYHLLYDLENKKGASGSSSENSKKIWLGVWNLKVPNKVKTFIWRACTNSLPTMKRKVVNSSLYNNCKMEEETVLHAL